MLKNYIKIAYKVFLRRKFFTFISLFAISFTLIVLMVTVAILDHIFGPMPPETKLDRMLGVYQMRFDGPNQRVTGTVGYAFLDRYVRNLPNVERVSFCYGPSIAYSYWNGEKIKSFLKRTDGEFWQVLDFKFLEGGPFTTEDERNANFVAVINEATRRKFFGTEPATGKTFEVDGQRFRVAGVVANVPISRSVPFSDVWVPISTAKTSLYRGLFGEGFRAIMLANSSADFPIIKEEFKSRMAQMEFPDTSINKAIGEPETLVEYASRQFSPGQDDNYPKSFLAGIAILMVLFMLLPAVNLININVSRIMERASEIGVRKAFGASSWTLVGQFVVENVLLTLIGGAIAFLGSYFVLQALTESGLIPDAEFHLNHRIFLYGLSLAVFFGLFSGVYPAWKMSRLHPVQALNGGVR